MLQRLQDNLRLFWRMASYAVLGFFWAITLLVCWHQMVPRLGYIFAHRAITNDAPCDTPECDFSSFWVAGFMTRMHHLSEVYQMQIFDVWGQALFFSGAHREPFVYPPPMLLPVVLIAHLPFELGYFVWVGLALALAAMLLRWAKFSWAVILFGLLSPAALRNVEIGQVGVIGDAILLAGLVTLRAAPGKAGALFGLLSLKPQMGLLVPAVIAGLRSWRACAGYVSVCLVLILFSLAAFGWPVWLAYLTAGRSASTVLLNMPFLQHHSALGGISVFWLTRSLGAGLAFAYVAQGGVIVLAALGTAYIWWRRGLAQLDTVALTVFLSLLAAPYGYGDDMVAWSVALVALAERRGWQIGMLDALFWIWPEACPWVTEHTGVLLTPLVVALAVMRTLHESGLLHWDRVRRPAW